MHHMRSTREEVKPMKTSTREELKKELRLRAYSDSGVAPNDTMVLDDIFLDGVELFELLDTLVTRREKIHRSYATVGAEAGKKSYDDVVAAIDAIKALMSRLGSV
jgi:hypothetical protein